MAKYEAGFIGAGNMGGALALAAAKKTGGDRIAVACSTRERSEAAAQRLGCTAETAQRILSDSRFVFLGVKPQMVVGVVESLKADILASEGIFVSMLAGVSLEKLALLLGADKKIIRIMPNTPCAVGQGLILYAANGRVSEDELCAFRELMAPAGLLDELNEHLIDAASAVSGCGPAYAYLFIEALADGGVKNGLPRAKAQRYAAQMLLGSAEMVLRTGRHPGQLKDEVCSPGGSTIAGVAALERSGFRSAASVSSASVVTKRAFGYACRTFASMESCCSAGRTASCVSVPRQQRRQSVSSSFARCIASSWSRPQMSAPWCGMKTVCAPVSIAARTPACNFFEPDKPYPATAAPPSRTRSSPVKLPRWKPARPSAVA